MNEEHKNKLKIFISYSHLDMHLADLLVTDLEVSGFEVKIDRRDLPYGEKWQAEIAEFIRSSDTVVWLVSPNSLKSDWCDWELGEVSRNNKRLLPIVIETIQTQNLPKILGQIHLLPQEGAFSNTEHMPILIEVLNTDRVWIKGHTRLTDRAREWLIGEASLLRGRELKQAEDWKTQNPMNAQPFGEVLELILASRQAATRRQRHWIFWSLVALVFTTMLAGLALYNWYGSNVRTAEAQLELSRALAATGEPLRALANAVEVAEEQRSLGVSTNRIEAVIYDLLWNVNFPVSTSDRSGDSSIQIDELSFRPAEHVSTGQLALCDVERGNAQCLPVDPQSPAISEPDKFQVIQEFTRAQMLNVEISATEITIMDSGRIVPWEAPEGFEFGVNYAYQCFGTKLIFPAGYLGLSYRNDWNQGSFYILDYSTNEFSVLSEVPRYDMNGGGLFCHISGKYISISGTFMSIGLYDAENGRLVASDLLSLSTFRRGFDALDGILSLSIGQNIFIVSGANLTSEAGTPGRDVIVQPKVYSLSEGEFVTELGGHEAPVRWGQFIRNGSQFLTSTDSVTIRVWQSPNAPAVASNHNQQAEDIGQCRLTENFRPYYFEDQYRDEDQWLARCSNRDAPVFIDGFDLVNKLAFAHVQTTDGTKIYTINSSGPMMFGQSGFAISQSISRIWPITNDSILVVGTGNRLYKLNRDGRAIEIQSPYGSLDFFTQFPDRDRGFLAIIDGSFAELNFVDDENLSAVWAPFEGFGSKYIDIFRKYLPQTDKIQTKGFETIRWRDEVLIYCEQFRVAWGRKVENCAFFDAATFEPLSDHACSNAKINLRAVICWISEENVISVFDFSDRTMTRVDWPGFINTELPSDYLIISLSTYGSCGNRIGIKYMVFFRGGGGTQSPGTLIYDLAINRPIMLLKGQEPQQDREMYCTLDELLIGTRETLSGLGRTYEQQNTNSSGTPISQPIISLIGFFINLI